jgi:hypothetical protein
MDYSNSPTLRNLSVIVDFQSNGKVSFSKKNIYKGLEINIGPQCHSS